MLVGDQSKTEQNMCQDAWTLKPSHLKSRDSERPREYFATQVSMIDVLSMSRAGLGNTGERGTLQAERDLLLRIGTAGRSGSIDKT
jgi:hypothetical protein